MSLGGDRHSSHRRGCRGGDSPSVSSSGCGGRVGVSWGSVQPCRSLAGENGGGSGQTQEHSQPGRRVEEAAGCGCAREPGKPGDDKGAARELLGTVTWELLLRHPRGG